MYYACGRTLGRQLQCSHSAGSICHRTYLRSSVLRSQSYPPIQAVRSHPLEWLETSLDRYLTSSDGLAQVERSNGHQ